MANKDDRYIPLPGDVSHDFTEEDRILNFKPTIDFVEPEQVPDDQSVQETEKKGPENTLEDARKRAQNIVDGLRAVVALIDIAQARIDRRVNAAVSGKAGTSVGSIGTNPSLKGGTGSAGETVTTASISSGVVIKLDPTKDAHVIAAMKRRFPEKTDPTAITYEDYKQVIDCVHAHAPDAPAVSVTDMKAATTNPQRTDFGGYSNQQGENRPEVSSSANSIKPIDLEQFQYASILALFALLYPLIKMEDQLTIAQHLMTVPHI